MRVAVTGANGFLGRAICTALASSSIPVRAIVRRSGTWAPARAADEIVVAALLPGPELVAAISDCETVIHCAGGGRAITEEDFQRNNLATTEALLGAIAQAGARGPNRFLLLSSVSAGGPDGNTLTAVERGVSGALSRYGHAKWLAESAVRAAGPRVTTTILRIPAVYGPGDDRMAPLFAAARLGVVLAPSPDQPLSMIDVEDCAAGIVALCRSGWTHGSIGWIEDGERYTPRRMAHAAGAALGRKVRVWTVPRALLHALAWLAERRALWRDQAAFLTRDKVRDLSASGWLCDAAALRQATGWRPIHTFEGRAPEIARSLRQFV